MNHTPRILKPVVVFLLFALLFIASASAAMTPEEVAKIKEAAPAKATIAKRATMRTINLFILFHLHSSVFDSPQASP